ncbi:MAG: thioredoxin-disulfide reductase [Myxococcales bacterium]|nr:thioredoxin-disulfide reductase [Myxococcales bacterium]
MRNVIIIGSGPAGLTAAIYAARANLKPIVIEGLNSDHQPGGQLMITTEVENYPGFPHGVTGPKLMEQFRAQAERFGTEFLTEDVVKTELAGDVKKVWVESLGDAAIEGKTAIIATGAVAKYTGAKGEKELQNYGVSACATCDGSLFREEHVMVVGGGDTAMEEALYLANIVKSVTVVHRRESLRASKIMQDRAFKHPNIKFLWNKTIHEYVGVEDKRLRAVKLEDTRNGEITEVQIGGVFVAIGHTPASQIFMGQVDVHDNGYIKTVPGTTQTSLAGVFACGDVQDHVYRQAITAAGTGCMAAIEAERYISAKEAS